MSAEDNKALARRANTEGLNQKNLEIIDELCTPEFVFHNGSITIQGLDAYKQFLAMFFTAFPDAHFTIEDIVAEGDTVVVRRTVRGTHKGELMVIPPTGKQITMTEIALLRVANGRFVEAWSNSDDLGLLQQLGVIPMLGQAR